MKVNSARFLLSTIALLCGLAVAGGAQQTSASAGLFGAAPIEGSWRVSVQLKDCTSGNPIGDPFQSLVSLSRGGVQVETTSNPSFYPAERGPGHGNWTVLGPNLYGANSMAFITNQGQLAKIQTISQQIQYDRHSDTWTSTAVVQFFDPSGHLVASGCAWASAARFPQQQ
jgi:hypothetical protein